MMLKCDRSLRARPDRDGSHCVASRAGRVTFGRTQVKAVVPARRVAVAARRVVEADSVPATPTTPPLKKEEKEPSPGGSPPGPPEPPAPRKQRSWNAIAFDQVLDTFGDALRHAQRKLRSLPTAPPRDRLVKGGDGKLTLQTPKPVVLVLGSGWGAHSMMKVIDTDTFDVVVVSPRNHFVFTPMLPSCAVGTVEFRSLLEPVRVSNPFVTYFEATVDQLDLNQRMASCTSSIAYEDGRRPTFQVPYDVVVVSIGEQPATLGVPGVRELDLPHATSYSGEGLLREWHAYFMKEVSDTVRLRARISECFELASLPGTTDAERRNALRFVVVGGGPTGVEFAGTLADFVRVDLRQRYPELMKFVSVDLLQSSQNILAQFDFALQDAALKALAKSGVQVRLGVRVAEITKDKVIFADGESYGYGVCVWSAGNSARPLVQQLVAALPQQQALQRPGGRPTGVKLQVDEYLRLAGVEGALAMGDCASILGNPLPATAQVAAQQGAYIAHLINRGYAPGVGGMDQPPPRRPKEAEPEAWLLLKSIALGSRPAAAAALASRRQRVQSNVAPRYAKSLSGGADVEVLPQKKELDGKEEKRAAMALAGELETEAAQPFEFLSLGIMAYVGNNSAIQQIEAGAIKRNLSGSFAYLLWRSVYITKQVSFRNRVLILFDWLKTRVFGRDLSLF